jgi:hypothetical protein
MPRESLEGPEDLPKKALRQLALAERVGKKVPGMPNQLPTCREEPLLKARQ